MKEKREIEEYKVNVCKSIKRHMVDSAERIIKDTTLNYYGLVADNIYMDFMKSHWSICGSNIQYFRGMSSTDIEKLIAPQLTDLAKRLRNNLNIREN